MSNTNRRQFLLAVPPLVLGVDALLAAPCDEKPAAKNQQTLITISRETTRITEPLDDEGFPDYIAALNQSFGKGATRQNNFLVEMCRVVGPRDMDETFRIEFFKRLGVEPPADDGDYLVGFYDFAKQQLGVDAPTYDELNELEEKSQTKPWRAKDNPLVARWLNRYDGHLTRIAAASKRTHCHAPLIAFADEGTPAMLVAVLLPTLQYQRMLARALLTRAMLRLGDGIIEAAWSDALAIYRMARLVGRGPTLIDALVAYAMDSIGWDATAAIARHDKLTKQQIATFRRDLRSLAKVANVNQKIDTAERYMFLDCVCAVARTGPKLLTQVTALTSFEDEGEARMDELGRQLANSAVDWNEVLRMGNQYYDRLAAIGRIQDAERRGLESGKFESDIKALAVAVKEGLPGAPLLLLGGAEGRKLFSRQVGGIFISLLMPALGSVADSQHRVETRMTMADLALALADFKLDHGKYPDDVTELQPNYVNPLPSDAFSGVPFRYSRDGNDYLLYSIGVNRQDDGGRSPDDEPEGDDLVLRTGASNAKQ